MPSALQPAEGDGQRKSPMFYYGVRVFVLYNSFSTSSKSSMTGVADFDAGRRQSQHSDIAKAIMSNRAAAATSSMSTLGNITNMSEHELELPGAACDSLHSRSPTTSLGRALQGAFHPPLHYGFGHQLSDTPVGSAPPTAPGSPRM